MSHRGMGDRTTRKKTKTPKRKRVENREEAYEIMSEDGQGDHARVTGRL